MDNIYGKHMYMHFGLATSKIVVLHFLGERRLIERGAYFNVNGHLVLHLLEIAGLHKL